MTSRDFCYWLQGLFEIGKPKTLDAEQIALIQAHLNMVFLHEIDPSFPKEQQEALNKAHQEGKKQNPKAPKLPGKPRTTSKETLRRC